MTKKILSLRILGIAMLAVLLAIGSQAHAGTIYANEVSYAHQSDGTYQTDVFSGQPVTLLNVSGISFETTVGVTVYCDGNFIGFSKGLPMNYDMVLPCSTVDVYDAGTNGVSTGNVIFSYLEGTHTAQDVIVNTPIPINAPMQEMFYAIMLWGAIFGFVVWFIRKFF